MTDAPLTWLHGVNVVALRWFGLRLARVLVDGRQVGWTWLTTVHPRSGYGTPLRPWFARRAS